MGYQRPTWPKMVFRDAEGHVIPYGSRWPGSPPPDAYERITNPERLAPLMTVTHALIEYLTSEYRVRRTSEGSAIVLDPGPTAASLRFDTNPVDFHVRLSAGPVATFVFPVCACDACDETADPVADDLETTVFAVVAGRLHQHLERRGLSVQVGTSRSWSLLPRAERRRIRRLLRDTPDHWDPWSRQDR